MGMDGRGIVFYGVSYNCLTYDMMPKPAWDRTEDDDEEGQAPEERPWDRGDVDGWYLHTQGLLVPKRGQNKESHEEEKAAALAARGVKVGTHGLEEAGSKMWYIAAAGSEHVGDTESGGARLPELVRSPDWDRKLEAFFKLAGLPWRPHLVGWWVVARAGMY